MADQRKRKLSPEAVLRLFAYTGFVACSLLLMVALSVPGWNWRPSLLGTVIYGGCAVVMYRGEQQRKENLAVTRSAQQQRSGGFDFDDDDDPTTPPTRMR